ncbi:nucleoid-associated protein YgaU [Arthrobacter woluwensis]|uniref:LysM peptidoglycan-binding domain-containing protein n=1 Tax=Arthrobacter woluwensis TaxID=156980 RepID=UPI0027885DB5|nr:hypothetical protein [Arthrobacter woluwensis]MDQ0709397.1 nucleoid-associated protein YgaU [Arthrobacter woluwensis]
MTLAQPPHHRRVPSGTRADAVLSLCVLGAGAGLILIGWISRSSGSGRVDWAASDLPNERVETLVGSLALWAGSATVVWWLLSMLLAFLSAASEIRGHRTPSDQLGKWTPAFMRRLALAVLGLSLLGGTGAQAAVSVAPGTVLAGSPAQIASPTQFGHSASPGGDTLLDRVSGAPGKTASAESVLSPPKDRSLDPVWSDGTPERNRLPQPMAPAHDSSADAVRSPASSDGPGSLDPGWTPSAGLPEAGHLAAGPRRSPVTHPSAPREVEVRSGDSLWILAARELGPGATDVEIAKYWPRWHAANRGVIGGDPNRLLPGTVLTVPDRG